MQSLNDAEILLVRLEGIFGENTISKVDVTRSGLRVVFHNFADKGVVIAPGVIQLPLPLNMPRPSKEEAIKAVARLKVPQRAWRRLRDWMRRELNPLGGQDGTAETHRDIDAVDKYFSK